MTESFYDEIEIEDMTYDATLQLYHYPCPCGDRFEISLADLREGEDVGVCPSCSLMIRVVFEAEDLPKVEEEEETGEEKKKKKEGVNEGGEQQEVGLEMGREGGVAA